MSRLYKAGKLLLGVLASILFCYLVFRGLSVDELAATLRRVHLGWLSAALFVFFLGYCCRIRRWQLMLQTENPRLEWTKCAIPFMASISTNNVLPFRAGDLLRTFGFCGWLGVPAAKVLATLLAERLMDLLCLLCALVFAMVLLDGYAIMPVGHEAGMWGVALAALLILVLLLQPRVMKFAVSLIVGIIGRLFPNLGRVIGQQVAYLFETLYALSHKGLMPRLLLWSVAAWGFEAGVFYLVAKSIPELAAPAAAWLAMPVGTLSTLLPSTPGYVGTFHFFVASAAAMVGNERVAATSFALLIHITLWLPSTVWGGISFAIWSVNRSGQSSKEVGDADVK
jgi:uncharacterized protein (TIRG00374 family)